jgi:uncharacterized protein (TIGR02231 family)
MRLQTTALLTAFQLLMLLLFWTSSVMAADIRVDARIDAVKVYSEGASVTRRCVLDIPAGAQRLVFADLPATLDSDTLRISVSSSAVTLGSIEVELITDQEYVGVQERELRNRLQALADRRAELQDGIATAETQLKLLDSLATAPAGGAARPVVDAANLASMLSTMSVSAAVARDKIRNTRAQLRDLEKNAEKINADLAKIATARKQSYQVRALVNAGNAVKAEVAIEYSTDDAAWRWVYEARLDTATKRLTLGRRASVDQSSGENWRDATLILTTARPAPDATTPQVAALFVDLDEPRPRPTYVPKAGESLQEIVITSSYIPADLSATEYLADYQIPGRVTLDSDGEPRVYPVAEETMDVELVARVIPSARHLAYLEALFTYRGEVPIQGGNVQLYRDGAFVGVTGMSSLLPGAEARIQFGADERIRVVVREEPKQSGEKGLLSRQKSDEHKRRFEVTNYHSIPVAIEVIDRLPVAQNKDVRVDLLKGATPPTQENLEGKSGVLLWRSMTQPRQTTTIRHYYAVRYPAERELRQREEGE